MKKRPTNTVTIAVSRDTHKVVDVMFCEYIEDILEVNGKLSKQYPEPKYVCFNTVGKHRKHIGDYIERLDNESAK